MRSDKQLEASRLNGKKSRGPVTEEGRRNSAANRLRHGLYARTIVLEGESRSRFNALIDSLYAEYQPQTPSEELLVEKMAVAQWRLMRIWTYEQSAITRESEKQREATGLTSPAKVDSISYHFISPATLTLQERHLDFQFNRCYDRLAKLRYKVRSQQPTENKNHSPAHPSQGEPAEIPRTPEQNPPAGSNCLDPKADNV